MWETCNNSKYAFSSFFFAQAKEENELPEYILGTVRLNQVRLESAVPYWGEYWTDSDAILPGNRNIILFSISFFQWNVISVHGRTYSNRHKWLISYFMVWYDSDECLSSCKTIREKLNWLACKLMAC